MSALNIDGVIVHSDFGDFDETDAYEVSLLAGGKYTFTATDRSAYGDLDLSLTLKDAAGNLISSVDDNPDTSESLEFSPLTSGTYTIEVKDFWGNMGDYDIVAAGSGPVNESPKLTGTIAALPAVTIGQSVVITDASLLVGYSDANNDTLSVRNLTVNNGTVTNNNNGTWTYKPNNIGQTTLSYQVWDGTTGTTATNSVNVAQTLTPEISIVKLDEFTTEDGGQARIQVAINTAPSGDTTSSFSVTLTSTDPSEGIFDGGDNAGASVTFTFNKTNWNTPQIATLKGVQDYSYSQDGNMSYTILATAKDNPLAPAPNYKVAIRDLSTTLTFVNKGDVDALGMDRDQTLYLIGDDPRPAKDLLQGNDGPDRIYGGYDTDELYGNVGDDRVYGSYEDDALYGGAGKDDLYGEQDDDYLSGGTGDDRMDGGLGKDTMAGGADNDTYYVTLSDYGDVEDTVVEFIDGVDAGGTDSIWIPFQVESYIAPEKIEIIRMNAGFGNSSVTGNTSANGIYGNAGNNTVAGDLGADTLDGGSGDDVLNGGTDNDIIVGGVGRDTLIGGAGKDVFDFNASAEMGAKTTADVVSDFSPGDLIDLATIDANLAVAGDQKFAFVASAKFTATAQVYFSGGYLYGNTDANFATAEFVVQFAGVKTLAASDIVL